MTGKLFSCGLPGELTDCGLDANDEDLEPAGRHRPSHRLLPRRQLLDRARGSSAATPSAPSYRQVARAPTLHRQRPINAGTPIPLPRPRGRRPLNRHRGELAPPSAKATPPRWCSRPPMSAPSTSCPGGAPRARRRRARRPEQLMTRTLSCSCPVLPRRTSCKNLQELERCNSDSNSRDRGSRHHDLVEEHAQRCRSGRLEGTDWDRMSLDLLRRLRLAVDW
jgi:hypothetical protein